MKLLYSFFISLFLISQIFAQAPSAFNYQAVLRDVSGTIRSNALVAVRIDILQTSASGTSVYAESFSTTTNTFGIINLQIGKGSVISGTFNSINWGNGSYFVKVTVDGTEMGTSQLLSVPYALYAGTATNGFSGNYNDLTNKPTILDNTKHNTATGYLTLNSNSTGSANTAYGHNALKSNTTGYNNTANGANALNLNTEGRCNTAIGNLTLNFNTTGAFNTSVGNGTLSDNTTGNDNTAIGSGALGSNSTGSFNIAIGSNSLYSNNTTNNNTAIGFEALKANLSRDNTALGYQTLIANTNGYENVAIGANSLSSNTIGNANTAIGKNALTSNTTGTLNTAIGCYADITQGASNSTAIGNGALVTSSDKIVLGNSSVISIGGYAAWTNYSDRRLKENIIYTSNLGLNFITRLKPASYNYIQDNNKRRRDGFIAQDVEQTLKDLGLNFSGLVIDNDKDKTENLSYAEFVIPLVTAVQELNQKNQTLETTIMEMKAEMEKLKQQIQNK